MDEKNKKIMADNIRYYMKLNNLNSTDMLKIIDVPSSTFSNWITGIAYPRIDKIQKMADYFGISKSDLVEEKKPTVHDELSPARNQLLAAVQDMSEEEVLHLLEVIKAVKGMR